MREEKKIIWSQHPDQKCKKYHPSLLNFQYQMEKLKVKSGQWYSGITSEGKVRGKHARYKDSDFAEESNGHYKNEEGKL